MDKDSEFDGRVAVVTGAAGGIGREIARTLAARGARIVVADLPASPGQVVADGLEAQGSPAIFHPTDVTSPTSLHALMERTLEAYGRGDVMCNNAGVAGGAWLLDWSPEDYERVVAVNQHGVFYGIQAAARAMRDLERGGVIVNTGSIYGRLATLGAMAYQASKAAVEIMTKVAALELAPLGIRVVNVAPGVGDTPMVDGYRELGIIDKLARKHMGKALVQPQQVAQVVAFVASAKASCINGTTVYADDGYSAFK